MQYPNKLDKWVLYNAIQQQIEINNSKVDRIEKTIYTDKRALPKYMVGEDRTTNLGFPNWRFAPRHSCSQSVHLNLRFHNKYMCYKTF